MAMKSLIDVFLCITACRALASMPFDISKGRIISYYEVDCTSVLDFFPIKIFA